jgi:hypothetical protein
VCRAECGVERISVNWCSVGHGVGGGEGDEGEGEKVAAVARGESGRRLCEEGVFSY